MTASPTVSSVEATLVLVPDAPAAHWLEYVDWANPVLREPRGA